MTQTHERRMLHEIVAGVQSLEAQRHNPARAWLSTSAFLAVKLYIVFSYVLCHTLLQQLYETNTHLNFENPLQPVFVDLNDVLITWWIKNASSIS